MLRALSRGRLSHSRKPINELEGLCHFGCVSDVRLVSECLAHPKAALGLLTYKEVSVYHDL